MKTIKLFAFLISVCSSSLVFSQDKKAEKPVELTWYTDVMKAHEVSKTTNKPLFAFFTGSDWCGWCKKLQADVFSKPEFIQWAAKNVVLVELDFPRGRALSPELQQQNSGLQQTFHVTGYPTIWIFSMEQKTDGTGFGITALGSLGYPPGATQGKEQIKFLADANAILEKKNTAK